MITRATRTVFLTIAGLLVVGMIVVALLASRSYDLLEQKLALATVRQAQLRADLKQVQRAAAAKPIVSAAGPSPSSAPSAKPASKSEPPLPPRTRPPGLRDFARDNPQLWNDFVNSKRVELGRLYLPVMLRLNLTPQQREQLKDILAAEIARGSDIGAAADAQGLAFTDPAIKALQKESEHQQKRELVELLGPAGFRDYEDFERAMPLRGFVDGLATQLAATAPLSANQADQLERALAAASEAYRKGDRADPRQLEWESVDRQAAGILTPDQFAVWQRGTAHNIFIGTRRDLELQAIYDRAVKRTKEAAGIGAP